MKPRGGAAVPVQAGDNNHNREDTMTQAELDRKAAMAADVLVDAELGWQLIRQLEAQQWQVADPIACTDQYELADMQDEMLAALHAAAREVDAVQSERTDWRM